MCVLSCRFAFSLSFVPLLPFFATHFLTPIHHSFLTYSTKYPFGLYYGMLYALIELSTPFVNIHWFLNKLDLSGSRAHLVNGLLLITTFATCRLAWGSYLTVVFFRDVWTALHMEEESTVVIVYGEPGSAGKG